nr:flavodoxin family protein [Chloroflexota bacterium]
MKQKRVLGIVGSPRRGGNTETLVDEALRGAEEAGASTEKIILSTLDIAPCEGCDACEDSGVCIHADDMEGLLRKMSDSDVWVLGTPVYWWGPSAQFKTFVDRWYAKVFRDEDKAMFQGRRIVLVVPFGDSEVKTARHVVGMMTDALDYVEAELFATVLAPGVNDPGEVRQYPDVLAAAYRAGKEAVSR